MKFLTMEKNRWNVEHWDVVVDDEGKVIEGGIRKAVRKGPVMDKNCWLWWGLRNIYGDTFYGNNVFGREGVVYGRMVDGVMTPVEEGLFYESDGEDYYVIGMEGDENRVCC